MYDRKRHDLEIDAGTVEHSRSDRRINHKLKEWKQIGPLQRITQVRTHLTASSAMIAELISKLNKGMVGMIDGLILRT
jgi:hypothetical protein